MSSALRENIFSLFVAAEGRNDLRVGVDDVGIGAEHPVDRPVRAEDDAVDAEGFDAAEHPRTQQVDVHSRSIMPRPEIFIATLSAVANFLQGREPALEIGVVARFGNRAVIDADHDVRET